MPSRYRVAISRCGDYDEEKVSRAVSEALALLGGASSYVKPGQRVLLKPNLLMRAAPERAVTTHPSVLRAVIAAVQEAGAGDIVVADSPGGRTTAGMWRALFEQSGLAAVCSEAGVRSGPLDAEVLRVNAPAGKLYTSFNLGAEVARADVVISLPKLKTHGFMMYTGAVKNLFGCIPGLEKAQFHLKVPDRDDFAEMLVDLMLACRPALAVMDAVTAMQGEGPSSGEPRHVGAVLASDSCTALDVVASSLTSIDPMTVYTNRAAAERDLGPRAIEEVEILGADWRDLVVPDFAYPAADVAERFPPGLRRWARRRTASRPYLQDTEGCTACRTCERNCPVSAIRMENDRPRFDYDSCIRCYCCQELCPQNAIALKTPVFVRLAMRGGAGHKA
jgi:uncharacterized protein (DUF362 family)/NAD-dependent dihydropyrimidine dehydrogenase PreA subunit